MAQAIGKKIAGRSREARLTITDDSTGMTLQQIGDELHVTRERARQIEKEALAKCRVALEARGFTLADLLDFDARSPGLRGRTIRRSD